MCFVVHHVKIFHFLTICSVNVRVSLKTFSIDVSALRHWDAAHWHHYRQTVFLWFVWLLLPNNFSVISCENMMSGKPTYLCMLLLFLSLWLVVLQFAWFCYLIWMWFALNPQQPLMVWERPDGQYCCHNLQSKFHFTNGHEWTMLNSECTMLWYPVHDQRREDVEPVNTVPRSEKECLNFWSRMPVAFDKSSDTSADKSPARRADVRHYL